MTEDEKNAARRRVTPTLRLLLAVKEAELEVMRLNLQIGAKPDYDVEDTVNRLIALEDKFRGEFSVLVQYALSAVHHDAKGPSTQRAFEAWLRQQYRTADGIKRNAWRRLKATEQG